MQSALSLWGSVTSVLERIGTFVPQLGLRLILGYEFLEAGLQKLNGENWFGSIKEQFIFPFNLVPTEFSWFLATWAEVLGALALFVGLATRFFAATLAILTIVAALAVHWPAEWNSLGELWQGYAITDKGFGNYKLPLLFLLMLLPLIFNGPGKASLDHLISRSLYRR